MQISQLFAALSLVGFAYVNFISTRHSLVERLFEGVDKAYAPHKWISIGSMVLVTLHIGLFEIDKVLLRVGETDATIWGVLGRRSFILFLALVLIAIFAKKMNYEIWKFIHKFMSIPYCIGLVHYYGAADYAVLSLTPFSIWLNLINFIGIISVIYSIFLYEKIAYPYRYKVSDIKTVAKDTSEITGMTIKDDTEMEFTPGQFAFLKFPARGMRFPSHPFTMSNTCKKGEIQFAIKNLGDHTANLVSKVKIGDEFLVTRPHGMFNFLKGNKYQIWIAGGIGITPFRSFYQSGITEAFSIDFFYCYNNEEEAPYIEEVKALDQGNLRTHLIDDSVVGFLTVDMIKEHVDIKNPVDIYFCGPKPMRDSLIKSLKNSGLDVLNFYFDHFEFK
jgi:predicted ferric reductase